MGCEPFPGLHDVCRGALRRPGGAHHRDGLDCDGAAAAEPEETMNLLSDTRNFRRVDDELLTAGQPDESQLADAAQQGVKVVINLALHDDPRYSLADEAG